MGAEVVAQVQQDAYADANACGYGYGIITQSI